MKKFKVRKYNYEYKTISVVDLTIDEMVKDPYNLNMADVGTILLNQRRLWEGLEPMPEDAVADSIVDFEKRGSDERPI